MQALHVMAGGDPPLVESIQPAHPEVGAMQPVHRSDEGGVAEGHSMRLLHAAGRVWRAAGP
jgi:hypothetical protein